MLVEVELANGKIAAGLFAHRALSESVGYSIAAFARCSRHFNSGLGCKHVALLYCASPVCCS